MSQPTKKFNDHPIEECRKTVNRMRRDWPGLTVYQKFTCEKCGERLTMETPNTFFETGTCDQCGHVTDIAKNGCNYLLSMTVGE